MITFRVALTSLSDSASQCEDRPELTLWFGEGLLVGGEEFHFSDVELATAQETLVALDKQSDVVLHNPLPGDEALLSACLAFIRSQNPNFPTDGIIGRGEALCLFPALSRGYVTKFDDIRRDGIGRSPKIVQRESVGSMSDISGSADLYTSKHGISLDAVPDEVGAFVVDLRKREWRDPSRRLDELEEYLDDVSVPVVYYVSDPRPEVESLLSGVDRIEFDNSVLSTARTDTGSGESSLSKYAEILSAGERSVTIGMVHHPEMKSVVTDLANMKQDLRKIPGLALDVGWIFNLLTELPVKPKYWEEVIRDNYHYQSIGSLIENLRAKAQNLDGMTEDLVINYCQAANYLQKLLNSKHPLQDVLFEKIAAAEDRGESVRFVVRNDYEREALLAALAAEGGTIPDSAQIEPIDENDPKPETKTVITRPMNNRSYLYSFPVSRRLEFLHYEIWESQISRKLRTELDGTDTTIQSQAYNQPEENPTPEQQSRAVAGSHAPATAGEPEPTADSLDRAADADAVTSSDAAGSAAGSIESPTYEVGGYENPNELLEEVLEEEFEGTSSNSNRTGDSAGQNRSDETGGDSSTLEITFEDGTTETRSALSRVTIATDGDIARIPATELELGDEVLIVDTAANDVYDLFVESAHEREQVRGCETTIDRWRNILIDGLQNDYTASELIEEMQERGSSISDETTIASWGSGRTLGPRDDEDVRRVLEVLEPESSELAEPTVSALKEIRTLHRTIGQHARRSIEAGVTPQGSIDSDLVGSDIDVSEKTKRKIVKSVSNDE
ncbi:DrmE family protein [Halomicrobium salinisoli]|uniref:DrmE family protein n=1 Tax=Halomicrobium salinisoli TaxID=2878391 RepID=UPI001CF0C7C4|nr:DrmE family protein [Halomicrobium salinisoli]